MMLKISFQKNILKKSYKFYFIILLIIFFSLVGFKKSYISAKELDEIFFKKNNSFVSELKLLGEFLDNKEFQKAANGYQDLINKIEEKAKYSSYLFDNKNNILSKAYMGLGFSLDFMGKDNDALKQLQIAVKINPILENHLMLQTTIGAVYGDLGLKDKEIESYQKVIKIDPKFYPAYLNLSIAYGEIGSFNEAIQVLKNLIKIKPDYAKAYYQLAKGYEFIKEYNRSIEYYLIAHRLFSRENNKHKANEIQLRLNKLLKIFGRSS